MGDVIVDSLALIFLSTRHFEVFGFSQIRKDCTTTSFFSQNYQDAVTGVAPNGKNSSLSWLK